MNYGLIGCGNAGVVHAYHFTKTNKLEFTCACDTDPKQIKRLTALFTAPSVAPPKKTYTDYREMLEAENLDVVSIATPPIAHPEQVSYASEKGIATLCEKPLATTWEESEKMVRFCKERGTTLGVMLPRRFYNNTIAARRAIERGLLGRLTSASFHLDCRKPTEYYATWRGEKEFAGGGVLMSQSIHSIDQLAYMLGLQPIAVTGTTKITRLGNNVEDEAQGEIYFDNGLVAQISASANSDETWEGITKIKGTKGEIILNSAETRLWGVPGMEPPAPETPEQIPEQVKPGYYGPGHLKVINDFQQAIEQSKRPTVTAEHVLPTTKAIFGIYKSAAQGGKKINLNEL